MMLISISADPMEAQAAAHLVLLALVLLSY